MKLILLILNLFASAIKKLYEKLPRDVIKSFFASMKQVEAARNSVFPSHFWNPAFAGVTKESVFHRSQRNFGEENEIKDRC
uniref:Uncharacterized protein n=1 Tax=candidate division CPR3 bacterium TaxID=2268181 RepID=A0A7V3JAH2_UNCC3